MLKILLTFFSARWAAIRLVALTRLASRVHDMYVPVKMLTPMGDDRNLAILHSQNQNGAIIDILRHVAYSLM
jgi:hypothetical protein